jgi:arginine:ornithine antiporter / lysine permease
MLEKGFGDFIGFLSGWGYWISAWTGTIGFAVLMMTSADYFFPSKFANSNGSLTVFISNYCFNNLMDINVSS